MTAPAPAAPTKKTADLTTYVVLRKNDDGTYTFASNQKARTTKNAIKAEHGDKTNAETYVAIPASSFTPLTVTPQTVTTLKLEQAKA